MSAQGCKWASNGADKFWWAGSAGGDPAPLHGRVSSRPQGRGSGRLCCCDMGREASEARRCSGDGRLWRCVTFWSEAGGLPTWRRRHRRCSCLCADASVSTPPSSPLPWPCGPSAPGQLQHKMAKQTSLQRLFRKSGLFGTRKSAPQLEATRRGSLSFKDRASVGPGLGSGTRQGQAAAIRAEGRRAGQASRTPGGDAAVGRSARLCMTCMPAHPGPVLCAHAGHVLEEPQGPADNR